MNARVDVNPDRLAAVHRIGRFIANDLTLFIVVGFRAWVRLLFIDTHSTFFHETRSP